MNRPAFFSASPAAEITHSFRQIEQDAMHGLPVCNDQLTTEVVGLRRFEQHWVGALITPWTLQLILLPATTEAECLRDGDYRTLEFPQGPVVFMASDNSHLGVYMACSLMSPLHDFPSQGAIRQTAQEVMELLFQPPAEKPQSEPVKVAMPGRLDIEREAKPVDQTAGSRRDFLRGRMK
ncbi:[NiFe]-hydrogenase assembly chaperone HybE [Sedimenticola sp.]|uniref:[NiFe]-hydrogenase assembly chaperone HybE n=1 Tax=Sedimenticola sp. TaxID=1940285 RepID=UPI003D0A930D